MKLKAGSLERKTKLTNPSRKIQINKIKNEPQVYDVRQKQVAFDKELIKSGTLYSKSDYYKVKDVYIEYQNALSNLAVKNKKDEIDEDFMDKSMINALYKKKFDEACSNEFMLCDILIDLLYDKNNSKCVVWDMCAETIIKNLIAKSGGYVEFPEEVKEDEEFSCCRKKFKMKRVYLGDKIDGEI